MGVELAIRTQGYPQLIKQLGIVPPQQGPFWGLSTVVAPTYIVGANAEVSTSGPRFNNDQIIAADASDPLPAAVINATPALKRGRYVFNLLWVWSNGDAVNALRLEYVLRDTTPANRLFVFLDFIHVTGVQAVGRAETTFTADILDDGWTGNFTVLGAAAAVPMIVMCSTKFHKYGELPLERDLDVV